ncbi:hypothetical protein DPSP01_012220 [Paraphaeosphaeria sporulosa]|uniref:Rhodopsin domain-containing protein n=1 Tax=Paraphaeosphaeria sporulosa TaxID=1460663 RepID=A0A177CL20_9PLEO|nr:uncharacterized protein CC84DRAFT_1216489 [Paraphaeosphaeria sporulosa]OAG07550.1 hypothetical protein CC84DRAFT_1216489 [Paraphaeosphaeria sporulosa]
MELKQLQVPVVVVCALSALIATFAIVCRVWARALTRKKWEANDWLMVIAYVGLLGELIDAIVFVFVQYYGVHIKDVPVAAIVQMKRHPESRYILTSMALSANVFCNLSITQLYATLFPYTRFRIVCRALLALTVAYYISFMTVQFFSCPQKMDNALAMAQKCAENSRTIWVGASAGAMCIDLANVVLPLPLLWRLNVDFEKKVRLTLLFGLGFL